MSRNLSFLTDIKLKRKSLTVLLILDLTVENSFKIIVYLE